MHLFVAHKNLWCASIKLGPPLLSFLEPFAKGKCLHVCVRVRVCVCVCVCACACVCMCVCYISAPRQHTLVTFNTLHMNARKRRAVSSMQTPNPVLLCIQTTAESGPHTAPHWPDSARSETVHPYLSFSLFIWAIMAGVKRPIIIGQTVVLICAR